MIETVCLFQVVQKVFKSHARNYLSLFGGCYGNKCLKMFELPENCLTFPSFSENVSPVCQEVAGVENRLGIKVRASFIDGMRAFSETIFLN